MAGVNLNIPTKACPSYITFIDDIISLNEMNLILNLIVFSADGILEDSIVLLTCDITHLQYISTGVDM